MINIEVPMFISSITEADRALIGKVDKIRKKRNEVIHEGGIVNETDARQAIETIQHFVSLLDKNEPYERKRAIIYF